MRSSKLATILVMALVAQPSGVASSAEPRAPLYDEALVPEYTLPRALVMLDGTPVVTPDDWFRKRRPEILRLFEENVYGRSPETPGALLSEVTSKEPNALRGLATRKTIRVLLEGRADGLAFELLVYRPNALKVPSPVFLALNFQGNHAIHPDPGIPLAPSWMAAGDGVVEHRATGATRGADSAAWPVERILDRGYALATIHYGDIEPDHATGWRDGPRSRFGPGTKGGMGPSDWGAISAWAWGLRRALDALETQPDLDGRRVAVLGHSRLGKAALWAAAQDPRFALAISNESGEGGAALARRRFGETVAAITRVFPYWFASRYRDYADREDELPVDQHLLLALVAPRPLYVASAEEDLWADPRGEFHSAVEAGPVYRLLGLQGLGDGPFPAPGRSVGQHIGYHVRRGPHALTAHDWELYLDFADRHLTRRAPSARRAPAGAR